MQKHILLMINKEGSIIKCNKIIYTNINWKITVKQSNITLFYQLLSNSLVMGATKFNLNN